MVNHSNNKPNILIVSLKGDNLVNIAPPVGLYLMSSYLKKNGIRCDILDRELGEIEPYLNRVRHGEYDILGFSVSHIHMEEDLKLVYKFRSEAEKNGRNCLFIAGGQEATSNSRQWIDNGIDIVFRGFPDRELLKFCNNLTRKDFEHSLPCLDSASKRVLGICYKKGEFYVDIPSQPLSHEQLRELCYETVLETKLPYKAYWEQLKSRSADHSLGGANFFFENVRVYTTSHCPRRCGFCSSQSFLADAQGKESSIVMLTAEEIADLILLYVNEYGARSILFSDDDFPVGNPQGINRLFKLCDYILEFKKEGRIPKDIRFSMQARIYDFFSRSRGKKWVNWDLLNKLAEAGFMSIGMGVETYSDRVMKAPSINKIGVNREDVFNIVNAMLEVGLVPQTNLILGIPEYTPEELVETMEVAFGYLQKNCDVATTSLMNVMPGSPLQKMGGYEVFYRHWRNPYNGKEVKIEDYFIPNHPVIRAGIEDFQRFADAELNDIAVKNNWNDKIIAKRVVHVCNLIGAARAIDRNDVADRFRLFLDKTINSSEQRIKSIV